MVDKALIARLQRVALTYTSLFLATAADHQNGQPVNPTAKKLLDAALTDVAAAGHEVIKAAEAATN